MKKQLFALLLAALLLLTACGGPTQTAATDPTQAPAEKPAETAEEAERKPELKKMSIGSVPHGVSAVRSK